MVDGVLTYALLHSMCDLKTAQMNVNLIKEFMLYELELGHNAAEATKNICCVKDEDAADQSTVTRWLKKFGSDCKDLD